ncbi:MAG: helix-turn-helix domain-containing protein [Bacteroidales bacterium]|nr:helix-turn-helix domain-containing protein [Bacteroidales bacterium]
MTRKVLSIILSVFSALSLHANDDPGGEKNHFINITTDSGLAHNSIYDVCVDKNGCLWLGTGIGLSHYDGVSVKNHFKEEMKIRSNFINYVYYDSRDRVWAGSANGVAIYDIEQEKFFTLEVLSGTNIENKTAWFFEDASGTMWISFKKHGLISVNPDNFSTKQYFHNLKSDRYFSRIWFEPENGLYLAAHFNDGLYYVDLEKETSTPFSPADRPDSRPFEGKLIKGFIKIDDNSFCITCSDGGIYIVDPYARTYKKLDINLPSMKGRELRRAFRISDSHLAIVMNRGFFIYDIKKMEVVESGHYDEEFGGRSIHCIAGNLESGLIFGLQSTGVAIEQDAGFRFSTVVKDSANPKTSMSGSNVTGFAEINDTTIWVSTRVKGLFWYTRNEGRLGRFDHPLIPDEIEHIIYADNSLWIQSSYGIYSFNPGTNEVRSYMEGCEKILCMRHTPEGRITVLANGGVLEYDKEADRFVRIPALSSQSVIGIGSGSSGLIAMTAEKGIVGVERGKMTVKDNSRKRQKSLIEWPELIYEHSDGNIWASPSGAGIFISQKGSHYQFNTCSGLPSDIVTNIIGDDHGNVFVSTDRSLSMIPQTGKVTTITKSDGLLNFGFTRDAAFKTSDGDILIGSRDGFTIIHAAKTSAGAVHTTLKVEAVTSEGEEVPIRNNSISLGHKQNSFNILITDIDPHHMLAGKPLFCMEGHDNTWTPVGEDGKISYTGIKPGQYTLKSYDDTITPLKIEIKQPPLLSTIAVILYIACGIVLLVIAGLYIRKNEIRRKRLDELITEIEALQMQNMADTTLQEAEPAQHTVSVRESLLITNLRKTVEDNYTNPDFGVDELAAALDISRSTLNRRMRDMLNTTANNYIRDIRILKAEELLRTSSLQINEICYKVGFQTPSYFIKCFRKKYGKSPNEYANSSS